MSSESIRLESAHVNAMGAVLKANKELINELDDHLPDDESSVKIELENKHQEILMANLEAYKGIHTEDLPEGEEYIADIDVVDDILDKIRQ